MKASEFRGFFIVFFKKRFGRLKSFTYFYEVELKNKFFDILKKPKKAGLVLMVSIKPFQG